MKTLRDVRRENLKVLVDEIGGQKALADLIGKDRNQVWQWLQDPSDERARNISDRSARSLEKATERHPGWLDEPKPLDASDESQSVGLDSDKLRQSIKFLEEQFGLWKRVFIASERVGLIVGVYARLVAPDASNLVDLSRWLTDQMTGDENEREGEVGSTGGADRRGDQRRSGAA